MALIFCEKLNCENRVMLLEVRDRLKAFLVHALFSLCVALIAISIIYFVWYPAPLAKATGVTDIFLLLLLIDVIIGPVLTFVVYQKNKKTLKFDLAVIVILQLSALMCGLWTVYQGKPAWLVFNADRADVVRINEIDLRNIDRAENKYQKASLFFPKWVSAKQSDDINERNKITFEAVFSGVDIAQRPELYLPLDSSQKEIRSKILDLSDLYKYNEKVQVRAILQHYPSADGYLPLKANALDMVVLMNRKTAGVVRIVDLRPWN